MDITRKPNPPERVDLSFEEVGQFLDEIAPDWSCPVCHNDAIALYVTQPDGSIPAHVRLAQTSGSLIAFRSFAGICDRCGFVHTFDLAPFLRWRNRRREEQR